MGCRAVKRRVILVAGLLAACSSRTPTNPYDPLNPDTAGRPVRLWAIPAETFVRLHWAVPDAADLEGVTLLRIGEGGIDTVRAGIPLAGTFIDPTSDSRLLRYLLEVRVGGWSGIHRSDTSLAIPSPGECWVASGYDHLGLVSPWTSSLLPWVTPGTFIVDVTAKGGALYAAGVPGGILYRVTATAVGPEVTDDAATGLSVKTISASPSTSRLLIAHPGGLAWFDPNMHSLDTWPVNHPAEPLGARVAPDEAGAWVWYADQTVAYVAPGGTDLVIRGSRPGPRDIAPAPRRFCWIGDREGLWRIGEEGMVLISPTPALAVAAVSSDQCWACLADGSVALFSSRGGLIGSVPLEARLISVSQDDHTVWVVSRDGSLWKLMPDLRIAACLRLAEEPWAIVAGVALQP